MEENQLQEQLAKEKIVMDLNRKSWDQLTDSEKIERMRQEVKKHQNQTQYMNRRINALQDQVRALQEHKHIDGEVVIPVRQNSYGGSIEADGSSLRLVENYF